MARRAARWRLAAALVVRPLSAGAESRRTGRGEASDAAGLAPRRVAGISRRTARVVPLEYLQYPAGVSAVSGWSIRRIRLGYPQYPVGVSARSGWSVRYEPVSGIARQDLGLDPAKTQRDLTSDLKGR